jgi:hypothetical protein
MPAGSAAHFAQAHAAQPDPADLARVAQCGHRRELVVEVDDQLVGDGDRGAGVGAAQVDDRDLPEAEAGEVGVDAGGEFSGSLRHPDRVGAAGVGVGAHLADDRDAAIGSDHLADELVDEAAAVELGRVHVVDAEFHGAEQQRNGRVAVLPIGSCSRYIPPWPRTRRTR